MTVAPIVNVFPDLWTVFKCKENIRGKRLIWEITDVVQTETLVISERCVEESCWPEKICCHSEMSKKKKKKKNKQKKKKNAETGMKKTESKKKKQKKKRWDKKYPNLFNIYILK